MPSILNPVPPIPMPTHPLLHHQPTYFVHCLLLPLLVFKDMFSMPQPVSSVTTPEATMPVIDLNDTPEDLENFLCMVYPFGEEDIRWMTTLPKMRIRWYSIVIIHRMSSSQTEVNTSKELV